VKEINEGYSLQIGQGKTEVVQMHEHSIYVRRKEGGAVFHICLHGDCPFFSQVQTVQQLVVISSTAPTDANWPSWPFPLLSASFRGRLFT